MGPTGAPASSLLSMANWRNYNVNGLITSQMSCLLTGENSMGRAHARVPALVSSGQHDLMRIAAPFQGYSIRHGRADEEDLSVVSEERY